MGNLNFPLIFSFKHRVNRLKRIGIFRQFIVAQAKYARKANGNAGTDSLDARRETAMQKILRARRVETALNVEFTRTKAKSSR